MHFDPLHLKAFTALMAEGSVSRASLELRTSPSNVRRIWQSLEEQLGDHLFVSSPTSELRPTSAARLLDREMSPMLEEIRRFEASVKRIHQHGRALRLGADRNVFNTRHFGRIFNSLRRDERFRISFVEVEADEGRSALEAGACDMFFAVDGTPGRRFESQDLPPLRFDVACTHLQSFDRPLSLGELADLNWSLAAFAKTAVALDTLRKIEASGAGSGRLCSQHQFLRWAEELTEGETEAIVCVQPASFSRMPQVSFVPLDSAAGYPLSVTYLKQHPYEFLPTIAQQMDRVLSALPDGSRPSLS
ncbi:LysR family transcriptional regulator [Haloferula sp. BvORR071]|uniref:LysR family transcriptional regulator n=1 Tax=Haloferula sp. BvORR071 TaxID=1396141 RepID=UPI0009E0AF5E|nr:LysR family transcriptional regulator [Haloferula sp. BvORR071]